jgi:hypothetical protein
MCLRHGRLSAFFPVRRQWKQTSSSAPGIAKSITISAMLRRFLPICTLVLASSIVLFPAPRLHAQDDGPTPNKWTRKYKAPPAASRIQVLVLKDDNGKPIENAAVIFHPIEGDKDKGYMELKSDPDGKAVIDVIPLGDTVRLQIIARGFQTYGGDYKIDKPEMSMEIRMKRPGSQYSIYKNHSGTASNGTGSDKPANPDKNAPPPAQPDKTGNSGNSPSGSGHDQNPDQNHDQNQNQDQSQKQSQ